jgi:hypothetical protein
MEQLSVLQDSLFATAFTSHLSRLPSRMATKEKLAFLKAHPEELSPNILRQLKEEIVAQKTNKVADEASTKAKGSGQQPGSAREEIPVSQQKLTQPRASASVGFIQLWRFEGTRS